MTLKRKRFVQAYLGEANGNATKAAVMAGYSPDAASAEGSRLLKNAEVLKAIQKRTERAQFTADDALRELATIAEAKPKTVAASDKVQALKLFLQVYGRLERQQQQTGITVNIGFLTSDRPTGEHTVVMAPQPQVTSRQSVADLPHQVIPGATFAPDAEVIEAKPR